MTYGDHDRRVITATVALAAYRAWLIEHERAWLAGSPQPPFDDRALDRLSQRAEWVWARYRAGSPCAVRRAAIAPEDAWKSVTAAA